MILLFTLSITCIKYQNKRLYIKNKHLPNILYLYNIYLSLMTLTLNILTLTYNLVINSNKIKLYKPKVFNKIWNTLNK